MIALTATDTEKVQELVFSGGIALGGLILVFLDFVFTTFDSYETADKNAVRVKYRHRASLALIDFFASLSAMLVYECPCVLISDGILAAPCCGLGNAIVGRNPSWLRYQVRRGTHTRS